MGKKNKNGNIVTMYRVSHKSCRGGWVVPDLPMTLEEFKERYGIKDDDAIHTFLEIKIGRHSIKIADSGALCKLAKKEV